MKKNISNKIICIIMALVFAVNFLNLKTYAGNDIEAISLQRELNHSKKVLELFMNDNKINYFSMGSDKYKNHYVKVFDNEKGKIFVPKGSVIGEVVRIDDVVSIDYFFADSRIIVDYFKDGTVNKTVYNTKTGIISLNDGNKLNEINIEQIPKITVKREQAEIDAIRNSPEKSYKMNNNQPFELGEPLLRSNRSSKVVNPVPYYEDPDCMPYKAMLVDHARGMYIRTLRDLGYYEQVDIKVYETMYYFSEIETTFTPFSAGNNVTFIAAALEVTKTAMLSWLSAASVAITVSGILKDACKIVDESQYSYAGGKEVTVFDPTREKTFVEVIDKWSNGIISLSWSKSPNEDYRNPDWGHTARASSLRENNNLLVREAQEMYENNLKMYGVWKHGVGKLGY